jgi:signal transduction histidine kinase
MTFREVSPDNNEQLEITIQNLPIGVILFGPTGRVLFSNTEGANYLGYTSVDELLIQEDLTSMRKKLFETFIIKNELGVLYTAKQSPVVLAMTRKKKQEYTAHFLNKKTEEESWVTVRANPICDEHNELVMVVYSLISITEQKILQQRNDTFMAMASHELRNPVSTIKLVLQLLQNQLATSTDVTLKEHFNTIDQQVDQLSTLVTNLLDVSIIKANKFAFNLTLFDFDELANEIIKNLQLLSPTHRLILKGSSEATMYGDRSSLARVFINLITNAIKYSPGANSIEIRISKIENDVCVAVQDFGIGIATDNKEKIFGKFFQVVTTNNHSYDGLGMGLYISAGIVVQHGGTIWVESIENEGSTFYFRLPIQK